MLGEFGRIKVVDHLVEAHLLVSQDALLVLLTVRRESLAGVEEVDFRAIRFLGQQSGYGQGVGAVVTLPRKDDHASLLGEVALKFIGKGHGRSLDQIDRRDRFVVDRILIEALQFRCLKYFNHVRWGLMD